MVANSTVTLLLAELTPRSLKKPVGVRTLKTSNKLPKALRNYIFKIFIIQIFILLFSPETEGEAPKTPEAVEEPEDSEKTLDQYYAELANKALNISAKEVRKAGEGEDDSKWKNSTALEKDEDDFFVGKVLLRVFIIFIFIHRIF